MELRRTALSAVDDITNPRVAEAFHVELVTRPVTAHHKMIAVQSTSPAVHHLHLVRTADHWTE